MDKYNPKIVFFGNTKYSVIDAEALHKSFGLSAVVTIPDRIGQRRQITSSPAKIFAESQKIPVIEADKLTPEIIKDIKEYQPDFLVVAAYGLILPKSLLAVPSYSPLNVHHSLLPKYRGPSPAPAAILNDEKESGVSVIIMTDRVDAGDILKQIRYDIKPDETTDSLLTRLNILGSQAVIEVVERFIEKKINPEKQDETKATYTKKLSKEDGLLDLNADPYTNWLKFRAFGFWPGSFYFANHSGKKIRVKITDAKYESDAFQILKVLPEGKNEMSYKDFKRGLRN